MSDYATAIGPDIHARSIKACALSPMTGEVERASFGYDPAAVAEWALGPVNRGTSPVHSQELSSPASSTSRRPALARSTWAESL